MDVYTLLFSLVPVVFVTGISIFILNRFFQNEQSKRNIRLRKELVSTTLPVKLQAYERIILLLERINPEQMLFRAHKSGMSAKRFQMDLLNILRHEYEHNLTQQLYISDDAWSLVKKCKEDITKIVNISAAELNEDASGIDLTKNILTKYNSTEKRPTEIAINFIKKEVKGLV